MRRIAAALGGLALLAAAACSPSSLTPGAIDERGPADVDPGTVASGLYEGVTSEGDFVRFQVADDQVRDFVLLREGACPRLFEGPTEPEPVVDGAFAFTVELDTGGFLSVAAAFPSFAAVAGSYTYSGAPIAGSCPRDGGGSFAAAPVQ